MKRTVLAALAAVACFAMPARAQIIDSADHSYLTDIGTGLDWLDVTATAGMSFNQVVGELQAGGLLAGWRYATGDELNTLISNYTSVSIPAGTYGAVPQEPDRIDGLVSLLGSTIDQHYILNFGQTYDQYFGLPEGRGLDYTQGYLADRYLSDVYSGYIVDDDRQAFGDYSVAHYALHSATFSIGYTGSFLVRDSIAAPIPEPETYSMLLAGLALLGFANKRRQKASVAA